MTPASTLPTFKALPGDRGPLSCEFMMEPGLELCSSTTPQLHHPQDMAGPSQDEGFTHNTALQPQQPGLF